MLGLYETKLLPLSNYDGAQSIGRITENADLPFALRSKHVLMHRGNAKAFPDGFQGHLLWSQGEHSPDSNLQNIFVLPADHHFLRAGDVVRLNPEKCSLSTIYRKNAHNNTLIVTERCNNFCLMCSVPPKKADDSYIVSDLLESIPLIDRGAKEIVISGGEPTLLGDDLFSLVRALKNFLPDTSVHVLSNGRRFLLDEFAEGIAAIQHPHLAIGIPIYSDISNIHDYVVQADGAFDQTIRGILNLKKFGMRVEVRIVIHKQTYERLPQLARFIARNLLFVDQILFMGLELTGFTKLNLEDLWIDPADYQSQLVSAVETLRRYRMRVSIANHQLCVLDLRLWPYSQDNVSDWESIYMPACEPCAMKNKCGGFFASAHVRHSGHLKPFVTAVLEDAPKIGILTR